MQHTPFVEAMSADPFVRQLHRNALRLLNDTSLDRQQREFQIRRVQSLLVEHQAKEATKAQKKAAKEATSDQVSRNNRDQGVADPSQVLARRREFGQGRQTCQMPQAEVQAQPLAAVSDKLSGGRSRPLLTLKRA